MCYIFMCYSGVCRIRELFLQKLKLCLILITLMPVFASCAYAADAPTLQNSVERFDPGKTSNELSNEQEISPITPSPNVVNIKGKSTSKKADGARVNLKFRLKKIILTGNTIFSTSELSKLYKDKINTDVSLADLDLIAQKITEYYRNAGYVLSQAIIPPQEITEKGVVKIQIIEGYINKVSVTGCKSSSVCALLQAYGNRIAKVTPLNLETLERFSFLADDIPGAKVRAVLTRSQQFTGAADLTFIVEEKRYGGSFAYNNYNSQVLGRQQLIATANLNNLTTASETALNGIISRNSDRMRYISFTHRQQLNSKGLGARFMVSNIHTDPDMGTIGLDGFIIPGKAFTVTASTEYAWIRSHNKNLYLGGGFKFLNSSTEFAGATLFKDNIRSIYIYSSYNFLSGANTFNSVLATFSQGLKIFDAQGNPPSRVGENIAFSKIEIYASSSHKFAQTKLSSVIALKGQYAFNTVPSSETFIYGGIPFGYGYDPAEFAGDRGIDGLFELQYASFSVQRFKLISQLFAFVDCGFIWDINNVQPTRQSGVSAGAGYRINMLKHTNLDFIVAKPLKPSDIQGNANYTRLLFNVKVYV